MRVIVQRVITSSVTIDNELYASIDNGFLLLVGFTVSDNISNIDKMIKKIINLRIFDDINGKMNLNINDVSGSVLSISQFTLYSNTKKGNRPSFVDALNYNDAKKLYDIFNDRLNMVVKNVKTGIFGSDMKVNLVNDGPITIILEE